jgi:hypothetical protein
MQRRVANAWRKANLGSELKLLTMGNIFEAHPAQLLETWPSSSLSCCRSLHRRDHQWKIVQQLSSWFWSSRDDDQMVILVAIGNGARHASSACIHLAGALATDPIADDVLQRTNVALEHLVVQ